MIITSKWKEQDEVGSEETLTFLLYISLQFDIRN